MSKKEMLARLKKLLNKEDSENDGVLNRKTKKGMTDESFVIMKHVEIMVADLRMQLAATKSEVFSLRKIIESE